MVPSSPASAAWPAAAWVFYRLETPELTPHTGLLLAPTDSKKPATVEAAQHHACTHLLDYIAKHYHRTFLVHAPAIADVRPFTWQGWDAHLRYTYRLTLGASDTLWKGLANLRRRDIRKAEKLGYQLQATDDTALFRQHYEATYSNQTSGPPVASAMAERFVALVIEAGLAKAYKIADSQTERPQASSSLPRASTPLTSGPGVRIPPSTTRARIRFCSGSTGRPAPNNTLTSSAPTCRASPFSSAALAATSCRTTR